MRNPADLFKTWRGLPTQLFLLVILPFAVLALAATLMSLGLHQDAMRTMVAERDLRAVKTSADFLASSLNTEQEAVEMLASQVGAITLETFVAEHASISRDMALMTTRGEVLAYSGTAGFKDELEGLQIQPGIPQTIKTGKKSFLVLSAATDTGQMAVNIVPLEPLLIHVTGSGFTDNPDNTAVLVDSSARILAQLGATDWDNDPANHPGIQEALNGSSGFTYIKNGSSEHVVAYSPVDFEGWILILEEPWESVDTPYLRLTQFAPLILIPLLAFTLVALWFGASQIVRPLQKLESLASDLAWGDLKAIERPVGGVQEIQQLQNELVHLAHKVQDSQKSLHDYIGAINQGQEDERRRLARELHDETLQSLIALRQRIQLAQMKVKKGKMQEALAELETLSSNSIEELRRLTRALRPITLEDFGLVAALKMLAEESRKEELEVKFSLQGKEARLNPSVEMSLFRVVQEALSNVTRHAEATLARIELGFQPGSVSVQVSDNGKGFTPPRTPAEFAQAGHYGLLGMYERIELIGGKLSIQSQPGGTTLVVVVPK